VEKAEVDGALRLALLAGDGPVLGAAQERSLNGGTEPSDDVIVP
jgi:hypothetical protein